jgi:hypothetical protein
VSGSISCTATLNTSTAGQALCLDGMGSPVAWTQVPDFDFSQLDVPTASGAFAAGFVLVGIAAAIGKGFGSLLSFISR